MGLDSFILDILRWIAVGGALFAMFHAVRQRPDAFTATGKLTKPLWLGILGAAALLCFIFGAISLFGIFGVVAVGVYLVDVRPRIDEVQRRFR